MIMPTTFLLLFAMSSEFVAAQTEHYLVHQTAFVSKVSPSQMTPWACECFNTTEAFSTEIDCTCYGKELEVIPNDLEEEVHRITITHSDIKNISRDFLQPYKEALMDVNLQYLPHLTVIEEGVFRDMPYLRSVYISHAPEIKHLHNLFEGFVSMKFLSLRIVHTSLEEIPNLMHIPYENILHMLDIDGNKINRLSSNSVVLNAEQVSLTNNMIAEVEDFAFNGSQIGKLSLRGNRELKMLQKYAFQGLRSLWELDLSETSIESLPTAGLNDIEVLKVEYTPTMKTIPSVYYLQNLKEAYLTHHFHCCAFKYPKQHDPIGHEIYKNNLEENGCIESTTVTDTGQSKIDLKRSVREKRDVNSNWRLDYDNNFMFFNGLLESSRFATDYQNRPDVENLVGHFPGNIHHAKDYNKSDHSHLSPLIGKVTELQEARTDTSQDSEETGVFHMESAEISQKKQALCGNFADVTDRNIKCFPEPNALNPCEDIMGSQWLRISVWFVVILAVAGNVAVIFVLIFGGGEITVSKFLISNMAFGDLCMGLYLFIIASMDLHSVGVFFNYAFDWQYGVGCQIAGFLTVFASHLSVFALAVVTLERWFAITYAIHLNMRLNIKIAAHTMLVGWIYSISIAALPLFGISNYSSTSICLPMEIHSVMDEVYLYVMIITNVLAFGLMVVCYTQIYYSLTYETRRMYIKGDMTVAKKMALLVFTDFACWIPIAFFSLTALAGYPLIGVTRSKILLVFFYPLNSLANPYLYAIMTSQYRRDFFVLLSRCNICTKRANRLNTSTSIPSNNSNPIPLLLHKDKRKDWKDRRDQTSEEIV